jgi:hypothetical protein
MKNGVFWDVVPHGITSQKASFFIVTAVKTSNLTPSVYIPLLLSETMFHTHIEPEAKL